MKAFTICQWLFDVRKKCCGFKLHLTSQQGTGHSVQSANVVQCWQMHKHVILICNINTFGKYIHRFTTSLWLPKTLMSFWSVSHLYTRMCISISSQLHTCPEQEIIPSTCYLPDGDTLKCCEGVQPLTRIPMIDIAFSAEQLTLPSPRWEYPAC